MTGAATSGSPSSASGSRCCSPTAGSSPGGGGSSPGSARWRSRSACWRARSATTSWTLGPGSTNPTRSRCPARRGALGALVAPASTPTRWPCWGRWPASWCALQRSRGVERLQLKWFACVASLMLVSLLVAALSLASHGPAVEAVARRLERSPPARRVRAPGGDGRRDPAPPPLRHRRRHQPHAGLRRAHRDPGGDLPRARAADRAHPRPVERRRSRSRRWRSPRSSGRRARASRPPSTGASTAAATTPGRRSRRSARGCATSSTSTRSAARSRAWCGRRCSRRTCRCG